MLSVKIFDGLQDYQAVLDAMREFNNQRHANTPDEIWLLQHRPVFTLGQAGKQEHLLTTSQIPIIQSDRGGQITYHGPGQLIAYLLIDLKRRQLGVRDLVSLIENSVVQLLSELGIASYAKKSAPGVYVLRAVDNKLVEHKIASLGLRVRKHCSYHGLALNIDMDLSPFQHINPCGYAGLAITQLADILPAKPDWQFVENNLIRLLQENLNKQSRQTDIE